MMCYYLNVHFQGQRVKHLIVFCLLGSDIWETEIDLAVCYGLNCLGFDSREMQFYSCIQNSPYWLWGLFSFQFSGYSCSFPGIQRPWHKAHHSSPSSADVNKWSYASAPPMPSWRGQEKLAFFTFRIQHCLVLTLILPRSRTGTVWFYTSTSNKRAARPKLYTKSLTRDLKLMYSRLTLVRISIKL